MQKREGADPRSGNRREIYPYGLTGTSNRFIVENLWITPNAAHAPKRPAQTPCYLIQRILPTSGMSPRRLRMGIGSQSSR
jgi:hypothetical protein